MTENRSPLDPDPLAVPYIDAEVYGRGWNDGYAKCAADRSLAIRPFAWGLVGGAAVVLIIVLAFLATPR